MSSSTFVAGNDETFAVLMFVLVACLNLVIWIPSTARFLYHIVRSEEARQQNLHWLRQWQMTFQFMFTRPKAVKLGLQTLKQNRSYARQFIWPRAKQYFSWRLLLFILFFCLLSVVAYQKLTFDAYGILGLEDNAELSKVKKAYRSLSLKYHPDKDPSDEARIMYRQVRRAYKALTNREKWEEEEAQEVSFGVALPTILTDPEYAKYSMTLLIGVMVLLPCWMIYKLLGRNKKGDTVWVGLKKVIAYHNMAQPFFVMLGLPDCFEVRYQREERERLLKLVQRIEKNVPAGGLFRDPENIIPQHELTIRDIFESFCPPEVASRHELIQLLKESSGGSEAPTSSSPTGGATKRRGSVRAGGKVLAKSVLTEKLMFDPVALPHAADYVARAEHLTDEEIREAELYRRCVKGHTEDLKLEDQELLEKGFRMPTDDEISVATYYLHNILWVIHWHVQYVVPREQGRRGILDKLPGLYKEKLEELESARRQWQEDKKSGQVMSSQMRKILVRVFNKDTQCEKQFSEIIDEMRQMSKRWYKHQIAERQRMEREWKQNQKMQMKRGGR